MGGRGWFTGPGIGVLNGIFLRLDCTNDPLTAGLEINAATVGEPVLTLLTTDDDTTNPFLVLQNSAGAELCRLDTNAASNVFLGYQAGEDMLAGGTDNILMGYRAGRNITTGDSNVALGSSALDALTTGVRNFALGTSVLNNCTGNGNVGIGWNALRDNIGGINNMAIGASCLFRNTTGSSNAGIGEGVLIYNVSGLRNSGIGTRALYRNTGDHNIGIGNYAGENQQAGDYNVFVGNYAGQGVGLHTKSSCVMIGYQAGAQENNSNRLYIANSNTATPLLWGDFANTLLRNYGYFSVHANTATGALLTLLTLDDNITNPYLDLNNSGTPMPYIMEKDGTRFLHTYGTDNLFLGPGAGNFTLTASGLVGIGINTLASVTSGDQNVAIGPAALDALTTSVRNVAIGSGALGALTTGDGRNFALGGLALASLGTGAYNIAIGYIALNAQTGATSYNTGIGSEALRYNQTGEYNTAIGYGAGEGSAGNSHNRNTFIGYRAGRGITTGARNTQISYQSGLVLTTGTRNVGVGYRTLYSCITGGYNVAVGNEAGRNTTGSYNVLVGNNAGYNEAGSDRLYIANSNTATPLVYGEFDNLFMRNYAASALTASISNPLRTAHVTSGGALALFGVGHLHELEDGAGNLQTASEAVTLWAVETDDAEMPLRRWTTYPAGNAGPGYGGYTTANDVDNVAVTIIPNGTGDVVCVLSVLYAVCVSDGNTAGGSTTVNNGANVALYNAGGNTLTLAVAADGSTTLQRTADAGAGLSYDVSLLMSWI